MSTENSTNSDVQLLALMVAKILRDGHGIATAPKASEYKVGDEIRSNGSTDIILDVRINKRTKMKVRQHWWSDSDRDLEELTKAAAELAESISAIQAQRDEISGRTDEVRAAAIGEFAKARRRGLPYRLLWAEPEAIYDSVLSGYSISVGVQTYSTAAKLKVSSFHADCEEEVSEIIKGWEEEQSLLAMIRSNLDFVGATGSIDSVVVNALREAGHDVARALQLLSEGEDWFLDIGERGDADDRYFCLYWNHGTVYARIRLSNGGHWSEGNLTFNQSPMSLAGKNGKLLRDVVPEPVFGDDVRIRTAHGKKGGRASIWCDQQRLHFNAETGALWAA